MTQLSEPVFKGNLSKLATVQEQEHNETFPSALQFIVHYTRNYTPLHTTLDVHSACIYENGNSSGC